MIYWLGQKQVKLVTTLETQIQKIDALEKKIDLIAKKLDALESYLKRNAKSNVAGLKT